MSHRSAVMALLKAFATLCLCRYGCRKPYNPGAFLQLRLTLESLVRIHIGLSDSEMLQKHSKVSKVYPCNLQKKGINAAARYAYRTAPMQVCKT